jgi:hypothetical protein
MRRPSLALPHFTRAVATRGKLGYAPSALRIFRILTDEATPLLSPPSPLLSPQPNAPQSRWDEARVALESSLVNGGEDAVVMCPWTAPRQLPLHPDVLYRLTFQNRFSVDLNDFAALKRLVARVLDVELAWRPWFTLRGGACQSAAHAGSIRKRPIACEILDAHARSGVSALQAFADDFSFMTPLQTLMLVSDTQACRQYRLYVKDCT